jgi:membrane-associated protease RseP (regulator of RpoE activity)
VIRPTRRELLVHGGLYGAAWVTTTLSVNLTFAATLMTILTCHELGHYVAARRRGVSVSLPFFVPLPPWLTIGTLGAVIEIEKPIEDRDALFDVGAAGPIAGLVVTIPLLVIGLWLSEVGPEHHDSMIEGNSILYALLKLAVFGKWLPGGGEDVDLHPMAFAAWVGLLLTAINLMPIGQLDGGHVARAALGNRHETWSARLHAALPVVGFAVAGVMLAVALASGASWLDALDYAKYGLLPWCLWTLLIAWVKKSSGAYHPAVGAAPLDRARRRRAIAMLVIFCAIATPVPFRPVL